MDTHDVMTISERSRACHDYCVMTISGCHPLGCHDYLKLVMTIN